MTKNSIYKIIKSFHSDAPIHKRFFKINIKSAFSLIEISVVIVIIGILIAGISQGMDLYKDMKITTAQNFTKNSIVRRIPDLLGWWETTLDESFDKGAKIDGTEIDNWYDINPLSQIKLVLKGSKGLNSNNKNPRFKINGINNLPSLELNYYKTLECNYFFINNFSLPPEHTFFVVFNSTSNYGSLLGTRSGGAAMIFQTHFSGKIRYAMASGDGIIDESSGAIDYITSGIVFKTNKDNIAGLIRSYDKQYYKIQLNNNIFTESINIASRKLTNSTFYAGGFSASCGTYNSGITDTGTRRLLGSISEIIIYSRDLSPREYDGVIKYLSTKYNIKT